VMDKTAVRQYLAQLVALGVCKCSAYFVTAQML